MSAMAPIPGASGYASADVMANNAYNAAVAQLNKNRLNTLTQYGYTGSVDPTSGVLSGVRVDPHAIHGQLQDLLHGQAVEDMQANLASEDRGLVGGLAHQAGSELRFQHGSQDTHLGQDLTQQLADYQGQQQQAAETRDSSLWQAENDAANQAMSDQEGQTIDQLIAALGNPSTAQQDAAPSSNYGSYGGSGGGSGGGRGGKPGKGGGRVGRGPHRTRAIRRVLGGSGGRPAMHS